MSKLTLAQKILRITKAASVVERRGTAEEGWKYAKVDDILDSVRNLMDAQGLILTGDLYYPAQGLPLAFHATPKGCVRDVIIRWKLEDIRSAETRYWDIPGSGWDYGDKGMYKALTGSRKYALIFIFNLRIADEPEEFGYVDREEAIARAQKVGEQKVKELKEKAANA